MLFAAWLKTAAFKHTRRYFNGGLMSIALDTLDHLDLCRKFGKLLEVLPVDGSENEQTESLIKNILPFFFRGLLTPWQAIVESQGRTYTDTELSASAHQKPAEYVTAETDVHDRRKAERSLMDLLLQRYVRFEVDLSCLVANEPHLPSFESRKLHCPLELSDT